MTVTKSSTSSVWMASPLILWITACGSTSSLGDETSNAVEEPVIFGSDDRIEYGGISNSQHLRLANATASLFSSGDVSCSGGNCDLSTVPFSSGQVGQFSSLPLCSGERFSGQETGASCTAFLVGPNLFATAGHCIGCGSTFGACSSSSCAATRVVFGFNADANGNNEVTTVPEEGVYSCTGSATGIWTGTEDFAIFKVDRVVNARIPMVVRYSGNIAVGDDLLVLGHPDGLPLKVATNGEVKEDLGTENFGTSLDAFGGNSGSPVVNLTTGVVEGIHVRRPYWHYVSGGGGTCATANVCSQTTGCSPNFGTSAWAQATRLPWLESLRDIPLHAAVVATL